MEMICSCKRCKNTDLSLTIGCYFQFERNEIEAMKDGSTQQYDIFNGLYFYSKIDPNWQYQAGTKKKKNYIAWLI